MYKTKKTAPPVPPRPSIGTKPATPKSQQDELNNNNRLMQLECKASPVGRTVIYKSPTTSNVSAKHGSAINSKLSQKTILNFQKTNNQQNNDIIPIIKKENTRNYHYKYEDDSPLSNISLISSTPLPSSQLHTSAGCYSQSVLTQNDNFNNNKYNSILQLPENHGTQNNNKAYELKRNKTEIIIKLANSGANNHRNVINNIEKYQIHSNLDTKIDKSQTNTKLQNIESSNINTIKISNNNYEQQQVVKTPTPLYRSKSTLCTVPRKRSSIVFIEDTETMKKSAERLFSEIAVNKNNQSIDPYLSKRPEPEGGCENNEKPVEKFEATNQNKFKFNRELTFHEILISEISENREKKSKELLVKENFTHINNNNNNLTPIKNDRSGKEIENMNKSKVDENFTKITNQANAFNNKKIISECHINIDDSGLEDETERSLDDYNGNIKFLDYSSDKKISSPREDKNQIPPLPKSLNHIDNNFYVEKLTKSIYTLNQTPPITNSKLDSQLEILRKEMLDLRQLDISLLLQLRTLNDSIQEFRTMLQEQEQLNEESECSSSDESFASSENNKEFTVPVPPKQIPKKPTKPIRAESFQQKRAYKSRPAPQPPSISRSISKN